MANVEETIPKKALKQILKITTNEFSNFDVKNKLEMMAVKAGIKPVFLETSDSSYLNILERAATLLNLKYQLTNLPPPYFSRKPNVEQSFLNVWGKYDVKAIWIYRDVQVEPMISASVTGGLNEGHTLGYPACCVKWHEESRVRQVEAIFQDIREYISENLPEFADPQTKTEEETYLALIKAQVPSRHEDEFSQSMDRHLAETWERYPFAPHWACASCLSGESKETERLNDRYKEFVFTLLKWVKSHKID